jgi:hypothetical protein
LSEPLAQRDGLRDLLQQSRDGRKQQVTLGLGVRGLRRWQALHAPLQVSCQSAELALVPLYEAVQHPFRRVLDKLRADLDPRLIGHRQLFRASAPADGEARSVGAVGTLA